MTPNGDPGSNQRVEGGGHPGGEGGSGKGDRFASRKPLPHDGPSETSRASDWQNPYREPSGR